MMRHILHYHIHDVEPYINWLYFFHAWDTPKGETEGWLNDAKAMLKEMDDTCLTHAIVGIHEAWSEGDDIVVLVCPHPKPFPGRLSVPIVVGSQALACRSRNALLWCALPSGKGLVASLRELSRFAPTVCPSPKPSPARGLSRFAPTDTVRLPMLRQQQGETCLCLSDYIRPKGMQDRIALFCASVDGSFVTSDEDDPYRSLLSQTLADRLAEATAEKAHEEARKRLWAYAPDEQLTPAQLLRGEFQGIRPAVGYPSLPDQSINFLLDQALHFADIGVSLTQSGAMLPHASVSGLMIANPKAHYFSVGKIGADQLRDYSLRRGLSLDETKRFLASNLTCKP
ncbi:MAG: hypothetical protein LUC33_03485 [Prevotellaceae bacterium]|nr:hypothetical protein [Prevotellaceae bacterium]